MLRVQVYVNQRLVREVRAVRIKPDNPKPNSIGTYEVDKGYWIKHRYGDGAEKLAIKMLRRAIRTDVKVMSAEKESKMGKACCDCALMNDDIGCDCICHDSQPSGD